MHFYSGVEKDWTDKSRSLEAFKKKKKKIEKTKNIKMC